MKKLSLYERIRNWCKLNSRNKKQKEDNKESLEEIINKTLERQRIVQRKIDQTRRKSEESAKMITDFTDQMMERNKNLIEEANRNMSKI